MKDSSLRETAAVLQMENVADLAAYACAERRLETKLCIRSGTTFRKLPANFAPMGNRIEKAGSASNLKVGRESRLGAAICSL